MVLQHWHFDKTRILVRDDLKTIFELCGKLILDTTQCTKFYQNWPSFKADMT